MVWSPVINTKHKIKEVIDVIILSNLLHAKQKVNFDEFEHHSTFFATG